MHAWLQSRRILPFASSMACLNQFCKLCVVLFQYLLPHVRTRYSCCEHGKVPYPPPIHTSATPCPPHIRTRHSCCQHGQAAQCSDAASEMLLGIVKLANVSVAKIR